MFTGQHKLFACGEYPFSNDRWDRQSAEQLFKLARAQSTPAHEAAGLVIGAGGIPYILGQVGMSQLIVVDLSPNVTQSVKERIVIAGRSRSWKQYLSKVSRTIRGKDTLGSFERESRRAFTSLVGSHASAKTHAQDLEVVTVNGDVVSNSAHIADTLERQGRQLTFVNFTNVADYIEAEGGDGNCVHGRTVLSGLLKQLPVADDAVIVDSSRHALLPESYTPAEYTALYGARSMQ